MDICRKYDVIRFPKNPVCLDTNLLLRRMKSFVKSAFTVIKMKAKKPLPLGTIR